MIIHYEDNINISAKCSGGPSIGAWTLYTYCGAEVWGFCVREQAETGSLGKQWQVGLEP